MKTNNYQPEPCNDDADARASNFPTLLDSFFSPWELAKKKYSYIWQCCACGCASINISSATCPSCGAARCAYCQTTKVQVQ
ncbi:hypothetical protein BU16DRAFT_622910 [Lophium mytilinum]|uniref:RanBP2-type domain-containing protein n=1 Tax=Lophium mytilinum TaxID=390894 RepID=A0A6A6QBK5_9PEZI|nr:hypothetical protein BU16DRAFT_622910 [Lophium mytilinum]